MKITKSLTHIATDLQLEPALREDELHAAFARAGLKGFPPNSTSPSARKTMYRWRLWKRCWGSRGNREPQPVTYDVTYFPHADDAEVDRQAALLARDLEIDAGIIRELCASEIDEYLSLDAKRDPNTPRPQHRGGVRRRHGVRLVRYERLPSAQARHPAQIGARGRPSPPFLRDTREQSADGAHGGSLDPLFKNTIPPDRSGRRIRADPNRKRSTNMKPNRLHGRDGRVHLSREAQARRGGCSCPSAHSSSTARTWPCAWTPRSRRPWRERPRRP